MTIAYDAATQSYTISTAGRSTTFTAQDRDTPDTAYFLRFQKSGEAGEGLTMTRAGTSGPFTYRYVSGGAWERATLTSDGFIAAYDPFTFGVTTPDLALRRTGTGSYAITLVGTSAMDAPYALLGEGMLQADFQQGLLLASGDLSRIDSGGLIRADGRFFGEASLSSAANSFSGNFLLDDGTRFTGGWSGRFYGPDSDEVGAVWYLTGTGGEVAAGYLLGRQDGSIVPFNTSLAPLQFAEGFAHRYNQLIVADRGSGDPLNVTLSRSDSLLHIDPAAGRFTYSSADGVDTRFTGADRVAAASDEAVDVYRISGADGFTYTLTLNKPGAANPAIALTYVSFGHWEATRAADTARRDRWFVWGVRTNSLQVPTGTGHFDGVIRGTAARADGKTFYTLGGTGSFDLDFSASRFTGSLNPVGTSLADNSTRDFGSFSFANGRIDSNAGLNANIVNAGNDYLGTFEGALFGSQAAELGGSFGFQSAPNAGSAPRADTVMLSGVVVAKRADH